MVKGISRRVVVVESPDPQLFEQAIFIVRNDVAQKEGITPEQLVREACRVARSYASGTGRRDWRSLPALCWAALGAGLIGLLWLVWALALG